MIIGNPNLATNPIGDCDPRSRRMDEGFPRERSELVDYAQHRPNLGNIDGRCPSILFDDDPDEAVAAIDALCPDQAAMLAEQVAAQAIGDEGFAS